MLNERGRLGHLATIEEAYDQLMHEAFGRVEVDLYTAAPLDGQELESIKELIHKALGKDPVLYAYTQPSMIGGVKLRIGDHLIYGSVSNRRRRLRQTLKTSRFSALRDRIGSLNEEGEA